MERANCVREAWWAMVATLDGNRRNPRHTAWGGGTSVQSKPRRPRRLAPPGISRVIQYLDGRPCLVVLRLRSGVDALHEPATSTLCHERPRVSRDIPQADDLEEGS